jgi:hypothetical protein
MPRISIRFKPEETNGPPWVQVGRPRPAHPSNEASAKLEALAKAETRTLPTIDKKNRRTTVLRGSGAGRVTLQRDRVLGFLFGLIRHYHLLSPSGTLLGKNTRWKVTLKRDPPMVSVKRPKGVLADLQGLSVLVRVEKGG